MKRALLVIPVLILCMHAFGQIRIPAHSLRVYGIVRDADTHELLLYANVWNNTNKNGTITDTAGNFRLYAYPGDTIRISSMGYVPFRWQVPDSAVMSVFHIFDLEPAVYRLREVPVYGLNKFEKLKYEIKNMKLPEDDISFANRNFPDREVDGAYYQRDPNSFGLVLSPITALYNAFSKEAKEQRKLRELLERDRIRREVEKKYNVEMIMRITGLDKSEAEQFMKKIDLPDSYILKTSEYNLIRTVKALNLGNN